MAGPGGTTRRTATVTVLFCDLVSSTARQARVGDDAADDFRRAFFEALTSAVAATSGEVVKNTGDGLMIVFRESAVDAVTCASRMHDEVEALDVDEPASVRIGVSAGEAAAENNDWFGTPVVEAARLCGAAQPAQTLVSEIVRALVGSRGGYQFRSVGALPLKGLPGPLPAAAVIRTPTVAERRRPRRLRARWVTGLAVALVAAAGVATTAALLMRSPTKMGQIPLSSAVGYVPRLESTRCPGAFLKEVPNGTCAALVVPEDRTKPRGRALHLLVTRAPALVASAAPDPTIAITRTGATPATSPARDHAEVISIGTRLSLDPDPEMACPAFEPVVIGFLTRSAHDVGLIAAGQRALRACHDHLTRSGVALSHYTYQDAGDDVIDLVRALHLRSVNLTATDRLAVIAYVVVRDASKVVRSLTLLNPWPPQVSLDPTAQLASAFDQYVALCRADRQCAHAYPDLAQRLRDDWLQANAHPQVVIGTDPTTSYRHAVLLNGDTVAEVLAEAIGDPEGNRLLAAGIVKAPKGGLGADVVLGWRGQVLIHDFPWAGYLSGWCSQHLDVLSPGHTISSQSRPELAGLDDGFYPGLFQWACAAWAVPEAPASAFAPVASNVPTLIVVAPLDPRMPLQAAPTIASGLAHATILTLPTLGAGTLDRGIPPCLNELRRAFLDNPQQQLNTTQCASQSPRINFVTSAP